jgi:two-component system NtrC family response regulator
VVASLGLLLKRHGHATRAALSPEEALRAVAEEDLALVLQDMNFSRATSGREGLELLAEIRRRRPQLPVVLITAWGSIALAVEGLKAGAADFITKPWSNAQLLQAIETTIALAAARLGRPGAGGAGGAPAPAGDAGDAGDAGGGGLQAGAEVAAGGGGAARGTAAPSRDELEARLDLGALVGADPRFLKVLDLVGRVAPTDAAVLITGESGTGKELVAEAIHRNSRRRNGPFVKVNLGGISSTLFESEMFGHVRGAFTDARADRKGRFEMAHGGTIFLDEIGEIDLSSQVKLLRVLQDRTYEVLGSSISRTVDIRVVSATNRDLGELVARGQFREDLLYRLNLIGIRLPALRERPSDVPLLARHFLALCAAAYRRGEVAFGRGALEWLAAQSFPGNVRQLRQTIERAVLVLDGQRVEAGDLAALAGIETGERGALPGRPGTGGALPAPGSMTLEDMERAMIANCLRHYEGNVSRVAEALGLSRAALYRRLEKYRLDPRGGEP